MDSSQKQHKISHPLWWALCPVSSSSSDKHEELTSCRRASLGVAASLATAQEAVSTKVPFSEDSLNFSRNKLRNKSTSTWSTQKNTEKNRFSLNPQNYGFYVAKTFGVSGKTKYTDVYGVFETPNTFANSDEIKTLSGFPLQKWIVPHCCFCLTLSNHLAVKFEV